MATGKEHEEVGRDILAVVSLMCVGLWAFTEIRLLVIVATWVGMWAGLYMVTPDADLLTVTRSESRWFKDAKKRGAAHYVWAFIRYHLGILALEFGFWPGLLLRHRGVSHVPVAGAVAILALMALSPLGLVLMALAWRAGIPAGALAAPLTCFAVGFIIAHLVHIWTDRL